VTWERKPEVAGADGFEAAAEFFEARERLGELRWSDGDGGRCYQRQDGDTTRLTITRDGQRDLVYEYVGVDLDELT
jgi:hypothetical protein